MRSARQGIVERGHPQLSEFAKAPSAPARRCDVCGVQAYSLFLLPDGGAVCEGCYSVQLVRRERGGRQGA